MNQPIETEPKTPIEYVKHMEHFANAQSEALVDVEFFLESAYPGDSADQKAKDAMSRLADAIVCSTELTQDLGEIRKMMEECPPDKLDDLTSVKLRLIADGIGSVASALTDHSDDCTPHRWMSAELARLSKAIIDITIP